MQPTELEQRVSKLTNHQWKLLEVLIKAGGEWVTRRHIANTIGKRRLIPYDIGCLQLLEERELVDIEHVHDDTPIGYQVVYRISESVLEALEQLNNQRHEDDSPPSPMR